MTEAETPFRLTVVQITDGSYLVNNYRKRPDTSASDLSAVIEFMSGLNTAALTPEPYYFGIAEKEKSIIESVRALVLRRDKMWQDSMAAGINALPKPPGPPERQEFWRDDQDNS